MEVNKVRYMVVFHPPESPKSEGFELKCDGLTCKNVLPTEGGKQFSKKCEKISHVVKNRTKKREVGRCNVCVGGLGPLACGRAQFSPSESNKKSIDFYGTYRLGQAFSTSWHVTRY